MRYRHIAGAPVSGLLCWPPTTPGCDESATDFVRFKSADGKILTREDSGPFDAEVIAIAESIATQIGRALLAVQPGQTAPKDINYRDRDLVQAIGVPIYTTDAEGHIEVFNDAAVALWGRPPVPGVDKWCGSFRLFHADGSPIPHNECPMALALKGGRPVRGVEIIAERPDGTLATILPFPTPLFDDLGRLTGTVNVLADVTDQKLTQHDL